MIIIILGEKESALLLITHFNVNYNVNDYYAEMFFGILSMFAGFVSYFIFHKTTKIACSNQTMHFYCIILIVLNLSVIVSESIVRG